MTVLTYVLSDVFLYDNIRCMMVPHITTGYIVFPDRGWVTVMFFCLFFWNRNVMDTVSANRISELDLSLISVLFLKNQMSFMVHRFVFRVPVTVKYSQLRIPKKKAPFAN